MRRGCLQNKSDNIFMLQNSVDYEKVEEISLINHGKRVQQQAIFAHCIHRVLISELSNGYCQKEVKQDLREILPKYEQM